MVALRELPSINPDKILSLQDHSKGISFALNSAIDDRNQIVDECIALDQSFVIEAVIPCHAYAGKSLCQLQDEGWLVTTIVIGVDSVDISRSRVQERVDKGGHSGLLPDLTDAFNLHLKALPKLLDLSDRVRVYDNSKFDYRLIAQKDSKYDSMKLWCPNSGVIGQYLKR